MSPIIVLGGLLIFLIITSSILLYVKHRFGYSYNKVMEEIKAYKNILLIVEDDPDYRKFVVEDLKKNYEVVEASSEEEAIKSFKQYRPKRVLLDLKLPPTPERLSEPLVKIGLSLIKKFKQIDQTTFIIVITSTIKEGSAQADEVVKLGANGLISKTGDGRKDIKEIYDFLETAKKAA